MPENTESFDFSTLIDRRGSSSYKWDDSLRHTGRENLLPFWVADMDFPLAPVIHQALQTRLNHGVFGYTFRPESLDDALVSWFSSRHNWAIKPGWLLEVPGIVPYIHILVRTLTRPGDAVIIQEPVYYPFRQSLERNGRTVADSPLVRLENGHWAMDLEGLADTIERTSAKLLILCNPHNPVGRAWSSEELSSLARLCRDRDVCVVSDEIHADLVMPGYAHTPWLTLPEAYLPRSIALVSATKTFNIPALNSAFAVIPDNEFRSRLSLELDASGMGGGSSSVFGYTAAEAAWRAGGAWLDALLVHLSENDRFLRAFLADALPAARISDLEATYLEWINLSDLGLDDELMYNSLLDAGLWLSRGSQFGRGGKAHVRMNIACPRSRLDAGLKLMVKALG